MLGDCKSDPVHAAMRMSSTLLQAIALAQIAILLLRKCHSLMQLTCYVLCQAPPDTCE